MPSETSVLIDTPQALKALIDRIGSGVTCAIDTEADSLHRYKESLCLIQFSWQDESLLIDPLAIDDLAALGGFFGKATIWMHGADYDMTMLRREFGELPDKVYDTQIGARLLGVRKFGLANLVEHYFGVKLSKTSQKADWGRRPLPDKMVEYALNDVRYLLPMGGKIVAGLKEQGRYEWFLESCEAARLKVLERDESRDEPWRIQGSGRLDRRGLNYLKTLWEWRDAEAESWDRPSFMVMTNRQLLEWSTVLAERGRIEPPGHFRPDRRKRLTQALAAAEATEAKNYPGKIRGQRRRRDADFERGVADLIKRRDKVAGELDIESSLIASRSVIEMLAAGETEADQQLLGWQKGLLGID